MINRKTVIIEIKVECYGDVWALMEMEAKL